MLRFATVLGLLFVTTASAVYADGPDGVVRSEVSNPWLSGFDAPTGGGAGFVPVAGVEGSGVIRGQVFNPDRGNGGGQVATLPARSTAFIQTQEQAQDTEVIDEQAPELQAEPLTIPATATASAATTAVQAESPAALPSAGDPGSALSTLAWLGSALGVAGLYLKRRR